MRRVPRNLNIRTGFIPGAPVDLGVSFNMMACHGGTNQGDSIAVAGFQFLRYNTIAFGISWLASDDPINYSLSIVDVNGVPLATSGTLPATPIQAKVVGSWTHNVSPIDNSWVWVYMTTDGVPFLDAVEWSMAMVRV